MRLSKVLSAALLLTSLGALGQVDAERAAEQADGAWLILVDHGKYVDSWKEASTLFRSALTEGAWAKQIGQVRGPLGDVASRKLLTATYSKTLPGAPDGEYVVAQFQTEFAHKKSAVETVVSAREKDESWRMAGYFIR